MVDIRLGLLLRAVMKKQRKAALQLFSVEGFP
jgi:hypothetical protein